MTVKIIKNNSSIYFTSQKTSKRGVNALYIIELLRNHLSPSLWTWLSVILPNFLWLLETQCSVIQWCPTLRPHGLQHARPPCLSLSPRVHPNPCPLSQWCHPTISSSVVPSPALSLSQHQGLIKWVSSSHQVAKVLEFQLQHQSFQWTPRTDLL